MKKRTTKSTPHQVHSPRLTSLARHFRILKHWKVSLIHDPDNQCVSWGGRKPGINRFYVGTWNDATLGPEPADYLLHEILHGVFAALLKIDGRRPKEKREAEEIIIQDICSLFLQRKS